MPIVHRNKSNSNIKQYLRTQKITYLDLANASGYSKGTIDQWMRKPLTNVQREIIQVSIEKIIKSRPVETVSISGGYNVRLRQMIANQNVSYAELGRQLGKSPSFIWNRINSMNLSKDEESKFITAIDELVAERRSLHED